MHTQIRLLLTGQPPDCWKADAVALPCSCWKSSSWLPHARNTRDSLPSLQRSLRYLPLAGNSVLIASRTSSPPPARRLNDEHVDVFWSATAVTVATTIVCLVWVKFNLINWTIKQHSNPFGPLLAAEFVRKPKRLSHCGCLEGMCLKGDV